MKKSFMSLAFGTFGLGVNEFVMMGILPYIARDFHITIAQAGHFISAYALGVCVGAPIVAAFARKMPLKSIMYILMAIYTFAGLCMAACPIPETGESNWQYYLMLTLRFIAGTPHGAYFGVGAVMADRLSKSGKAAFAVAIMSLGMPIANLIGNPLFTFAATVISWRYIFLINALWGIVTWVSIARFIPFMEGLPDHGIRGELRFLKTLAPWLLFFCTALGNGGVFCWYSYISPTLTQLAGVPESLMMLMMIIAGAGMVIGNLIGGRLSDIYGPGHTGRGIAMTICATLFITSLTTHIVWCAVPLMVVLTACLFAVSAPQQLLLIRHSKGGELMGGAMVQIAFNLGNAIGAWAGGLPLNETDPTTYHYPATIGACFAIGSVICYFTFCRIYEPVYKKS